jgi:hypothetical protein
MEGKVLLGFRTLFLTLGFHFQDMTAAIPGEPFRIFQAVKGATQPIGSGPPANDSIIATTPFAYLKGDIFDALYRIPSQAPFLVGLPRRVIGELPVSRFLLFWHLAFYSPLPIQALHACCTQAPAFPESKKSLA